ncbi:GntR family transcriptional regulator [Clostridium minihomine]|uniref:GntR family transcriptional regulator n=1 Tax=Clostridium minihomine TaxID=2045012 RepID=UPI001FB36B98|nr:GntR family transcriptional regulator [Clostridium minihomine]
MHEYLGRLVQIINLSQNRPLNDIVYEGLRKAIIQGVIPVGERLNEKVYSDYMNISRTPIRNAIKRLTEEDLVEYIPKYGVVVKRVTVEDAEEIYQIRTALETMATIAAMERMTEENHLEMQELLKKTEIANEQGEVQQVIKYFSEFNSMIYRFSRMQRLEAVVSKMQEYVVRFRNISLYDDDRRSRALKEHGIIYRGMQIKDKELISLMVAEHIDLSKQFVLKEIIRSQDNMKADLKDLYRRME